MCSIIQDINISRAGLALCLLVVVLCSAGCAEKSPEALSGHDYVEEYPDSRYLKAEGTGKTESSAGRQARAELANIFESHISNELHSSTTSVVDASEEEKFRKSVASNISITSSLALKGVKIGRTWLNEQNGLYHAVAVLDRYKAREEWNREVETYDTKIAAEFKTLKTQEQDIFRLMSIKKIVENWEKKTRVLSLLRVIGFSDDSFSDYDINTVFKMLSEIKARVRIHTSIYGEHGQTAKKIIEEKLSEKGFITTDSSGEADVLISGGLRIEDVDLDNPGVHFVRATLSLNVTDRETGSTVGEIIENTRKGHRNRREAVRKAIYNISDIVSTQLVRSFDHGH